MLLPASVPPSCHLLSPLASQPGPAQILPICCWILGVWCTFLHWFSQLLSSCKYALQHLCNVWELLQGSCTGLCSHQDCALRNLMLSSDYKLCHAKMGELSLCSLFFGDCDKNTLWSSSSFVLPVTMGKIPLNANSSKQSAPGNGYQLRYTAVQEILIDRTKYMSWRGQPAN